MPKPIRQRGRPAPAVLVPALFWIVIGLAGAVPRAADACTCTTIPSLEEERARSSTIFTGFPIGFRSAAPEYPDQIWVRFQVAAIWKGAITPTLEILTGANGGVCGIDFQPGVEYLVFALGTPGVDPLGAYLCGRTAPAHDNPDVEDLGPPIATPSTLATWGKLKALYRD